MGTTWYWGWYIVPAVDHYCRYRVYIPQIKAEMIVDAVEILPYHTKTPGI